MKEYELEHGSNILKVQKKVILDMVKQNINDIWKTSDAAKSASK